MYKNVFDINNPQWLTCHKTKPNLSSFYYRDCFFESTNENLKAMNESFLTKYYGEKMRKNIFLRNSLKIELENQLVIHFK